MMWRWAEHTIKPMHFGLTCPSVDERSVAAEALAALYDRNLAMWEFSSVAIEMERHVLNHVAAAFGLDVSQGAAQFTSGGQEANLTATAVALSADGGDYPMYTSMQWSRRFSGFKLFMMFSALGERCVANRLHVQALRTNTMVVIQRVFRAPCLKQGVHKVRS